MATCMLVGGGSQAKPNTETVKKADSEKTTEVTKKETETQPTEQDTQKAQEPIVGNAAGVANWHDTVEQIKEKGVNIAHVTLHVGLGTFRPVKVDDVVKNITCILNFM